MAHHNLRSRDRLDYAAMADGDTEPSEVSDYESDCGEDTTLLAPGAAGASALDPAAANGEGTVAGARPKQRPAAVPTHVALGDLADSDLDRRLAAAEAERARLEEADARERKLRRILAIERDNEERRRRAAAAPRGGDQQPRASGGAGAPRAPRGAPAAQLPQVAPQGPDAHNNNVLDMAALRHDPVAQLRAGRVLADLGLDSDDDSESDVEPAGSRTKQSRGRRLRSGMEAKATDVVDCPQFWPHVHLQLENTGRAFSFQELDLRLLVAGELEIISAPNIAPVELSGRLELLKSVVYTEGNLGWGAAKSLYAAVLRKIELGVLGWGDDFSGVSRSVLERSLRKPDSSRRSTASKSTSPQLYYCRLYQSGKCDNGDSHEDTLPNGRKVTVTHICAACWMRAKRRALHPESDETCPYHTQ